MTEHFATGRFTRRDPNSGPAQLKSIELAAETIKLKLEKLEVRNAAEMNQAFDTAKRANVDAAIILSSPFIGANAKLAAELTLRHQLPAVTLFPSLLATEV